MVLLIPKQLLNFANFTTFSEGKLKMRYEPNAKTIKIVLQIKFELN